MAYTNITSQLASNGYAVISEIGYFQINNPYNGAYGFATSAYNGTTYLASQNLNKASSAAGMRLNFTPGGTNGVNIKISYIVSAETNYDYGMFSKSGTTMASSCTYTSSEVYHHTRGIYGMNESAVTYYLPNSSFIDIMYKKDSSADRGIDRLLVKIEVEPATGGGGGTPDPGTTYYWMIGTRILLVGARKTGDGTYTLPSTALTSFTAHLEAYANGFPGANMTVLTSGNYRILWASGSSTSNIWSSPNSSNPQTTALPYILGGVFGHYDQNTQTYTSMIYTVTTALSYNPASVFGSINNTATFYQCRYYVDVQSDKNVLRKAYFDVNFGSPFNETWKTGKGGYVLLISSAANSSVSVTVSRTGSGSKSGTLTRPGAGNTLILSPTSNSDKICTVADLAAFDSSAAAAISTDNKLCVKYNSSIHDTGYSGTDKLMHIHEFLYFAGTPEYYKDDSLGGGGSTPTTGYEVTANVMSMNWTNSGPSNLVVQALTIYAGTTGTVSDDVLYSLLQPRTLTAGGSGSFTVPVVNDWLENVTYLTVSITCANYASLSISLNTQSQGSFYVDLYPGSGVATKRVELTSNITITGGTLNCSYASG